MQFHLCADAHRCEVPSAIWKQMMKRFSCQQNERDSERATEQAGAARVPLSTGAALQTEQENVNGLINQIEGHIHSF